MSTISYWFRENHRERVVTIDDLTGVFSVVQGSIIDPDEADAETGDLVGTAGGLWEVYAIREVPYAFVKRISGCGTVPTIVDISWVKNIGTGNFDITIQTLNATATKIYGIDGAPDQATASVIDNERFYPNVPIGRYVVVVFPVGGQTGCIEMQEITVVDDLAAEITGTNETAVGAEDGTVVVTVTAGSGQYEVNFTAPGFIPDSITTLSSGTNPQSTNRLGLEPNTYNVIVTDLISGQTVELQFVVQGTVVEAEEGNSFLEVPMMNSAHFVKVETPNGCTVHQTMDNVLFCQQRFPGYKMVNYFQKVQQCDIVPYQFYSDFETHELQLRDYHSGELIEEYSSIIKEQNTNQPLEVNVYLTEDTNPGHTRVYFSDGELPLPLEAGMVFTVFNNGELMNGNYAILSVGFDIVLSQQYLVINRIYLGATSTSAAEARFIASAAEFNVHEFSINYGIIPQGNYFITIKGIAEDSADDIQWTSEPISVKTTHENTLLFQYRNEDNAFDFTWTTGITCQRRVEATLFKRMPDSEDENYRNLNQSLVKLRAKRRRKFLLEFWLLPPYLHETLAVMWGCDIVRVNGVRYQTDEKYQDPKYITRYPLSNSQIIIEQYGWFDKYNSDDIGSVDNVDTGFIIVNNGFLKR